MLWRAAKGMCLEEKISGGGGGRCKQFLQWEVNFGRENIYTVLGSTILKSWVLPYVIMP